MVALIFSTQDAENQQIQQYFGEFIVLPSIPPSTHPVDNKSNIVLLVFLSFFTFSGTHIALCLLRVSQ
jgi:hypothetical protein